MELEGVFFSRWPHTTFHAQIHIIPFKKSWQVSVTFLKQQQIWKKKTYGIQWQFEQASRHLEVIDSRKITNDLIVNYELKNEIKNAHKAQLFSSNTLWSQFFHTHISANTWSTSFNLRNLWHVRTIHDLDTYYGS